MENRNKISKSSTKRRKLMQMLGAGGISMTGLTQFSRLAKGQSSRQQTDKPGLDELIAAIYDVLAEKTRNGDSYEYSLEDLNTQVPESDISTVSPNNPTQPQIGAQSLPSVPGIGSLPTEVPASITAPVPEAPSLPNPPRIPNPTPFNTLWNAGQGQASTMGLTGDLGAWFDLLVGDSMLDKCSVDQIAAKAEIQLAKGPNLQYNAWGFSGNIDTDVEVWAGISPSTTSADICVYGGAGAGPADGCLPVACLNDLAISGAGGVLTVAEAFVDVARDIANEINRQIELPGPNSVMKILLTLAICICFAVAWVAKPPTGLPI